MVQSSYIMNSRRIHILITEPISIMLIKLHFLAAFAAIFGETSAAKSYSGYKGVKYIFAFGASFDSTDLPGSNFSTSDGPMYLDLVSYTYNPGPIFRVNFAYPGATTNASIIAPNWLIDLAGLGFTGTIPLTLVNQVENFTLFYPMGGSKANWNSANSLFFWPGSVTANDIGGSYNKHRRQCRH
jgi:hypothetical protein